ncbi:TetR family transcriptional regulator [Orenia metallireducens]|uniref:Transcriptional regulator, TetR family n=1 Tax=Orenia metallireducens TaxID=1413210 RepID=A0A285HRR1_9FIRM|nr:TetR/AcrR family transcriptional regulator [Orenia metallireducens]PRX25128.1 TetR family transcriptional regulator [Orenia metallireducens]SNY38388.1 transcriptional regulator, TetR family [Orenia metallireducens]
MRKGGLKIANISKKDSIINAALKLFSNNGYHKTTVSQIAKEAKVAKGTVYWYFDSKKQLFQAIILTGVERLTSQIESRVKEKDDVLDKLKSIVMIYLEFINKARQHFKVFQEGMIAVIDNDFKDRMMAFRSEQAEFIAAIIEQGKNENKVRLDVDNKDMAYLLLSMVTSFNDYLQGNNDFNIISKGDIIIDVFLQGVAR